MRKPDTPTVWDLMTNGQFELAYARMTNEMAKNPDRVLRHISNRGNCLLSLRRLDEALADFQLEINLRPYSASCYIHAGVTLWWLGRTREAVATWRRGVGARYADAAGGVEVPALLFFAASRIGDPKLETEAKKLLKRSWKPKLRKVWPGPIAGFLLEEMQEHTFLAGQTYENSILEARRLCKAHFWVGLGYYRQGNVEEYLEHLQQSIQTNRIGEFEYYLATSELQSLGGQTAKRTR